MLLPLDDVKVQLRLEPDFTEHDTLLSSLVMAAQRSIERHYYCTLVGVDDDLKSLPEGVRGFTVDEDIRLAMKMMVSRWYLDPAGSGIQDDTPEKLGVGYLLFPLQEHTV
ncbi:phage gp6-like head-tail connector protein [Salmonella enterica]|nr:phage gp6-like head-tail connector protein [Salmonella enterica]EBA9765546.1 phage gp6-like head-tail connector protein [Salmonella enterica]EEB5699299.1 phage gp6-like head-tail connector protein [Salmonella enterica]EGX5144517.1 phage gp6-like head-tail connector protein [Salmonella enterica]ELF4900210.1 phage gp6-like head-tail connector protein [Salmonella enterica]